MIHRSTHVRVDAEYGTATLRFHFPGSPVNALDAARLAELDAAIAAVERSRHVRVLVVRGDGPTGFCGGFRPAALSSLTTTAEAGAFAAFGRRVCDRLARLDAATVAFVDGPCLGPGLELALACDYRLAVAHPNAPIGFPDAPNGVAPCFGGSVRLPYLVGRRWAEILLGIGNTLSARRATSLGLVDLASCERRGRIELRTFLDRLEANPRKRTRPVEAGGASERRKFLANLFRADTQAVLSRQEREADGPVGQPPPSVIGIVGHEPTGGGIAAGLVLRGSTVLVVGSDAGVLHHVEVEQRRGFVTPLEAEQARGRVRVVANLSDLRDAGLVFVPDGEFVTLVGAVVRPRAVIAVGGAVGDIPVDGPHPRRVVGVRVGPTGGVDLQPTSLTDPDTPAALAGWLRPLGVPFRVTDVPQSSSLVSRHSSPEPVAA